MPSAIRARAALLRITGVAAGSVAGATDEVAADADLVATFVFFAGFVATFVLFGLFVAFLDRFGFFIVCHLHGTHEPYACLERSKVIIDCLLCSTQFKIAEVGKCQVEQELGSEPVHRGGSAFPQ